MVELPVSAAVSDSFVARQEARFQVCFRSRVNHVLLLEITASLRLAPHLCSATSKV